MFVSASWFMCSGLTVLTESNRIMKQEQNPRATKVLIMESCSTLPYVCELDRGEDADQMYSVMCKPLGEEKPHGNTTSLFWK